MTTYQKRFEEWSAICRSHVKFLLGTRAQGETGDLRIMILPTGKIAVRADVGHQCRFECSHVGEPRRYSDPSDYLQFMYASQTLAPVPRPTALPLTVVE